jgi:hypothetical protein
VMLQNRHQLSQQGLEISGNSDFCDKNPDFLGLTVAKIVKPSNFAGFRAACMKHMVQKSSDF